MVFWISLTHSMADAYTKLHALALRSCQSGSPAEIEVILPCSSPLSQFIKVSTLEAMATMPGQFQGAFQAIAINVAKFSSGVDPPSEWSSAQQFSIARSGTHWPKSRFIHITNILGKEDCYQALQRHRIKANIPKGLFPGDQRI